MLFTKKSHPGQQLKDHDDRLLNQEYKATAYIDTPITKNNLLSAYRIQPMDKLLFSFILIILGVCCGYLFRQLADRQILPIGSNLGLLKRNIQKIIFLGLNPITVVGATWIAKLEDLNLIALPLLCICSLALGGIMAYGLAKLFGMQRKQTGAYLCCGTFTNIGALGALFCFLFLGEQGFALVPIYKLFEEFIYFAYIFPLVKSFSMDTLEKQSLLKRITIVFSDPFVAITIFSISLGLVLNLTGVHRPEVFATINSLLIPTIVFFLLFTIGLGMRFAGIRGNIKPALFITAAKFIFIPLIVTGLGFAVGLHRIDNGLPLKVVLILSAMPVGFLSVVPPSLYDLDIDLANTCWLICNILLIIQIPVLLGIITLLHF